MILIHGKIHTLQINSIIVNKAGAYHRYTLCKVIYDSLEKAMKSYFYLNDKRALKIKSNFINLSFNTLDIKEE